MSQRTDRPCAPTAQAPRPPRRPDRPSAPTAQAPRPPRRPTAACAYKLTCSCFYVASSVPFALPGFGKLWLRSLQVCEGWWLVKNFTLLTSAVSIQKTAFVSAHPSPTPFYATPPLQAFLPDTRTRDGSVFDCCSWVDLLALIHDVARRGTFGLVREIVCKECPKTGDPRDCGMGVKPHYSSSSLAYKKHKIKIAATHVKQSFFHHV